MDIDNDLCVKPSDDIVIPANIKQIQMTANLMDCPNEILFMLAKLLRPRDIVSLAKSSRDLGAIFAPMRLLLVLIEKDRVLAWAAHRGQLTMVKFLLENGATTSYRDPKGNHSALEYAAMGGYKSIVEILLENGADTHLDPKNSKLRPMNLAAFGGHSAIVDIMLRRGIKVCPPGCNQGDSTLHWAVIGGHEPVVRMVLEYVQGNEINAPGHCGATPLHYAAASGNEGLIKLLLRKGADITGTDYCDRGLLHYAAAAKHVFTEQVGSENISDFNCPQLASRLGRIHELESVTIFLLKLGVNINAPCSRQRTPLMQAAKHGNETVARLLLENGADPLLEEFRSETALHIAALHGHDAILNRLLEAGANINAVNSRRTIPIQEAANANKLSIVKKLLKLHRDAEMNPVGGWVSSGVREAALMSATAGSREEMVAFLLDQGSYIDAKNEHGCSGLHQAVDANAVGLVKLLLERGADTNVRDAEGITPLHLAARIRIAIKHEREGDGKIGELLVKYSTKCNATDQYWRTALHLASIAGRQMLVRSLLNKGVDITTRDQRGWTAFHWAAMSSNLAVVKILIAAGANINDPTSEGNTILHEMANRGRRPYSKLGSVWQNGWVAPCPEGQPAIQWRAIVQLLIDSGIKVSTRNAKGKTALNIASSRHWRVMIDNLRLTKAR